MADNSLKKDQLVKRAIYAQSGIAEYWIANLIDQQLECYRALDTEGKYGSRVIYKSGNTFIHPTLGEIRVQEILPF